MAPEVLCTQQRGNYTEKCDIYSAALVMWYIATCERPPDKSMSTVRARPDLSRVGWPAFEWLLAQMWTHEPAQRPSALEAVVALCSLSDKPDMALGASPDAGGATVSC